MGEDRRHRWVLLYALTVALLGATHLLALSLLPAHAVAAVATSRGRKRWAALLRTVLAAALGLLFSTPYVVNAARHATGATGYPELTVQNLISVFLRLFTQDAERFLGLGVVLLLALLGITRVASSEDRFIARLALAWAVTPPAVLLPVLLAHPNLLIGRYLIFVVPAWAILGGLGIVTLMDLTRGALERVPSLAAGRFRTDRRAGTHRLPGLVAVAVGLLVVTVLGATQLSTLRSVRTASGHGEDIRPALAAIARNDAHLPILVTSGNGAIEVAAYSGAEESRLAGLTMQRDLPWIWPISDSFARLQILREHARVVLLLRIPIRYCLPPPALSPPTATGPTATAATVFSLTAGETPQALVGRCMPARLRAMGYRVISAEAGGRNWPYAVLDRSATTGEAADQP